MAIITSLGQLKISGFRETQPESAHIEPGKITFRKRFFEKDGILKYSLECVVYSDFLVKERISDLGYEFSTLLLNNKTGAPVKFTFLEKDLEKVEKKIEALYTSRVITPYRMGEKHES